MPVLRTESERACVGHFTRLLNGVPGPRCWVAGGALREWFAREFPPTDIDVFATDAEALEEARSLLQRAGAKETFRNERITNLRFNKRKVQLISSIHYPGGPEECIASFDFTVCAAAVDHERVYTHPHFFEDLAARALVVQSLPKPLSTMQRAQKYIRKGYSICNGGLLEIARAVQGVDLDDKGSNDLETYPDGTPRFVRID